MNKQAITVLSLALAITLGMSFAAWAKVPPPPVNQNLGIPDSIFDNLNEGDCRFCHNQNPPAGIPVDPTYLPSRHHLLVSETNPVPIPVGSDVPNPDADGNGIPDLNYVCLSCHSMTYDPVLDEFALNTNFRDCTVCHTAQGELTVHHKQADAQAGLCATCHGNFVASVGFGQPAPTYMPSIVTPWPSAKPNGDDSIVNSAGTSPGNCNFCHNTADGTVDATLEPGPFGDVFVYRNKEAHHETGFFQDPTKCAWCHNGSGPPTADGLSIRTCQNCHDIKTLHNIQWDDQAMTGDHSGITPGAENAYFGHIGNQDDCWGCHGNNGVLINGAALTGAPTSATVAALYATNPMTMPAGQETVLTLTGNGFYNTAVIYGMTYNFEGDLVVTDAAGNAVTYEPLSVTPDTLEAVLPATLPAGNYQVAVKKGSKLSNPLVISIVPTLSIASVSTTVDGKATVGGSGFGSFLDAAGSGTTLNLTTTITTKRRNKVITSEVTNPCEVISWSDKEIVANCSAACGTFQVDTLFGSASFDVTCAESVVVKKSSR